MVLRRVVHKLIIVSRRYALVENWNVSLTLDERIAIQPMLLLYLLSSAVLLPSDDCGVEYRNNREDIAVRKGAVVKNRMLLAVLGFSGLFATSSQSQTLTARSAARSAPIPPAIGIGWHGVELGQAVTPILPACGPQALGRCTSNQTSPASNPISIHTDCFNYDDLSGANRDNPKRYPEFMQEKTDWTEGKRLSYCTFTPRNGRVVLIEVTTRQTPQEVIAAFSKIYGAPKPGAHSLDSNSPADGTLWQFPPPNPTPGIIFVKAREVQDPQTLERFVVCNITFKSDN
jgi:hypothetical protein